MTREDLSQLLYIEKEISMWERCLKELRTKSEISVPPTYVIGGRSKNQIKSSVENTAVRVRSLEEKIERLREKAEDERSKLLIYIAELDDSLLRQIVLNRCYKGLSWRAVAITIGGGNTADGVRQKFNRTFPSKKK